MNRRKLLPLPLRVISGVVAVVQIFVGTPVRVCAQAVPPRPSASPTHRQPSPSEAAKGVRVNRTIPDHRAPSEFPRFSGEPTDAEISNARVFEEPLIPAGGQPAKAENVALSAALSAYLHRRSNDDAFAITQFLSAYPESRWRGSILLNLGIVYRLSGYFSKALESWNESWNTLKNETEPQARALADRALAELLELNGRVGRYRTLKPLLQEIQGRDILGSADEKISKVKEGLWMMENKPGEAFLCGPAALSNVFAATHASNQLTPPVLRVRDPAPTDSLWRNWKL